MEGLGEKFRKAREARNLTLEEAARMTKIRPAKLREIEAEDFSQFPSLAYAKGFLLIYGKFLNVDVSPYLEAFETSEQMTVDGYSYLQDNPAPAPRRTEVVRRPTESGKRSSLLPMVVGLVILFGGFALVRFLMDIQRITPAAERAGTAAVTQTQASPAPAAPESAAGPPASQVPVDPGTPPPAAAVTPAVAAAPPAETPAPPAAPTPAATPEPTAAVVAEATPEGEPEVRRAEPVNPDDLIRAQAVLAATAASPTATPALNRYEVRPLRKTFVRVVIDGKSSGAVERWVAPGEALSFRGQRIAVEVSDPEAVEIRKNGRTAQRGDVDVRLE